jgi:hypothetical protein
MNQGMEEDGEWRWREVGEEEERQRQSVAASNNGTRVRFDDKIWRAMQLRLARTMGKKKGWTGQSEDAPAQLLALHRLTLTGASPRTGAASYDLLQEKGNDNEDEGHRDRCGILTVYSNYTSYADYPNYPYYLPRYLGISQLCRRHPWQWLPFASFNITNDTTNNDLAIPRLPVSQDTGPRMAEAMHCP